MYATNAASHTQILPVIKDTWFYTLVEGISLQMCRNFYSKYDLSDHLLTHDDVKHFSCKHCDKTFQTRGGLNSHKRIHNADYKYVCDHCGEGFIYKSNFKGHKAGHENSLSFICNVCSRQFRHKSSLARHVCGATKNLSCDICGSKFKAKRYLMDHLRAHSNPERFQYSTCGKIFKYRASFYAAYRHKKQAGHS